MRTYDAAKVTKATYQYAEEIIGFDPEEWLYNPLNVALINDNGDVALFEHQHLLPQTVCGHYFFFSRGKHAIKAAKEFLDELFLEEYYIERVTGLTPVENKAALWMNRHLGFKEYGLVETEAGYCKFVLMTKDEWLNKEQKT